MPAGFHEVRFPEKISFHAVGGPKFKTMLAETASGFEFRNVDWALARGEWVVSQEVKSQTEFLALKSFFLARRGRAYGFRFKDWSDYQADRQPIVAGQLCRRYGDGIESYDKTIVKPVQGTVVVRDASGVVQVGWSLNYTTGAITGTSADWVWSGEFDLPVRFDTDHFASEYVAHRRHSWIDIPLVELRPEEVT